MDKRSGNPKIVASPLPRAQTEKANEITSAPIIAPIVNAPPLMKGTEEKGAKTHVNNAPYGAQENNDNAPMHANGNSSQGSKGAKRGGQKAKLETLRPTAQINMERGAQGNIVEFKPRPTAQKKSGSNKNKANQSNDLVTLRPTAQQVWAQEADWLKSMLPQAINGWWNVEGAGKGFSIAFRWRVPGAQPKQTFPRIGREAFSILKEMGANECRAELRERIIGHLDDLQFDPERCDRARLVAERIGVELENHRDVISANYAS